MPPPLSSPLAPKRLAPPSRRQRSSSFPRPTRSHANGCSRLTRRHGDEQSVLVTLTFDLLTLKVMSESRVTWAISVPILVFLGRSVLDLGPMYATDRHTYTRQTDVRQHHRLMPPPRGRGHNNDETYSYNIGVGTWSRNCLSEGGLSGISSSPKSSISSAVSTWL